MKKYCTIAAFYIVVIAIVITIGCISYKIGIAPVSKSDKEVIIDIPSNSTYLSIADLLKENNLIKSESFYKIYIKIFKPNNLQAGTYALKENMGVEGIIDVLEGNNAYFNSIKIAIPEGKHITDVADVIASKTDYKKDEILSFWQSEAFIDKVITKYWFITSDIKNDNLRYNLEGYFFPATYEILKDESLENITYRFLDKMDQVLTKYKDDLANSSFSVHQVLTLASIVEHEAILDEDRPKIAKVFINRLNISMPLQSCATLGYAINEWKLTYSDADMAYDSLYNTYKYSGLPIGPGGLPGEKSIIAVLKPDNNDYLYFMANVYNQNDQKTYYAKTYTEHRQNCKAYLGHDC